MLVEPKRLARLDLRDRRANLGRGHWSLDASDQGYVHETVFSRA
jgi:hypothetical protein